MRATGRITRSTIDPGKVLDLVRDPSAGGTVIFLGTIRNRNEGREVEGLEYEVYKEMAEKRMGEIEKRVREKWPVMKVAMVHRYGRLSVGEVSVAVAVSSEHRAQAFEACRYAIDAIKHNLPLWKKERLKGGKATWVKGEPIEG
jgi:molybdopterin synthase catalytic subunit